MLTQTFRTSKSFSTALRAVHSDVHVLLRASILEKVAEGGVVFPYDAIHVDFLLKAA